MAHFAELDSNNIVLRVVVIADEHEANGETWCNEFFGGGSWKQTSYNNNIRKQYAGIGFTYDNINDVFIAPQPYASWSLNSNFDWQAPVAYPDDGNKYTWNEENLEWDIVT